VHTTGPWSTEASVSNVHEVGTGQVRHDREWGDVRVYRAVGDGRERFAKRTDGGRARHERVSWVWTRASRGGVIALGDVAIGCMQGAPLQEWTRLRMTGRAGHE